MAQNIQIDPKTRDYVVVDGVPVPSDRILEATYYALMIPQGKWIYGNSDQGSMLHTLQNQKRRQSIDQEFAAIASEAIDRQLVQKGIASAFDVKAVETTRTGTSNEIRVAQNENQLSDQLNFNGV